MYDEVLNTSLKSFIIKLYHVCISLLATIRKSHKCKSEEALKDHKEGMQKKLCRRSIRTKISENITVNKNNVIQNSKTYLLAFCFLKIFRELSKIYRTVANETTSGLLPPQGKSENTADLTWKIT